MSAFVTLVQKDMRLELRTGRSSIALLSLALLILVVLVFSLDPAEISRPEAAAGALWVALVFAGLLGSTRALLAEGENGCLSGLLLSPLDPALLYAAKLAASFLFMMVAEVAAMVLMVVFFNLQFGISFVRLAPVVGLGTLGFSALATLLAAVSSRSRESDLLLPVLAVPMFVPALIAGVRASTYVLGGGGLAGAGQWIGILVAFDVLFVTAGYLLFEHVISGD